MAELQIQKVNWWHQSIIDWELSNPHLTMNDCAAFFDVSPSWLSVVRNSDAFRAYSAIRRAEHNQNVSLGITGQLQQLAKEAVGEMLERVQSEREKLEFSEIKDAGALALKALGFGAGAMGNPNRLPDRSGFGGNTTINNINNVLIAASPDALARAREKMARLATVAEARDPARGITVLENQQEHVQHVQAMQAMQAMEAAE